MSWGNRRISSRRYGDFVSSASRGGEIQTGLNLAEQLLGLAETRRTQASFCSALRAGTGPCLPRRLGDARTHLEQAIAYYDRREHGSHAFVYGGHDPCVSSLGYAALSLWMLGYPEQALQRGREALALARELGHPASLAGAQALVALLHQYRRDVTETLELAEELQGLAADQGSCFTWRQHRSCEAGLWWRRRRSEEG